MTSNTPKSYYFALGSLAGLLLTILLWEMWLAPLKPGGSWLALKLLPLLFTVRGLVRRDNYTMQWTSMLVLLYFTEGVVRATSDLLVLSRIMASVEVMFSVTLFCALLSYLRPLKIAHKATAKTPQKD